MSWPERTLLLRERTLTLSVFVRSSTFFMPGDYSAPLFMKLFVRLGRFKLKPRPEVYLLGDLPDTEMASREKLSSSASFGLMIFVLDFRTLYSRYEVFDRAFFILKLRLIWK